MNCSFKEYPCFQALTNTIDINHILNHLGFTQGSLASECAFFFG